MTRKQALRAYRKLWESVTRYDGYQPFGYDNRTLAITCPGFFPARDRLRAAFLAAEC